MNKKPTTKKVQQLIQQVETKPKTLYLSASQLTNFNGQLVWSCILVQNKKILARFNNQQVIRPLEAKAYAVLRTVYWLLESGIKSPVILFTDHYDIWRRFLKLRQRPISSGYQLEPEFYYSKRSKIAWPYYLWLARKLISESGLDLTVDYLNSQHNPATLISQSLKVCAKCQQLKKIEPKKRNCYACWKASQQVKYERWKQWQAKKEND